MDTPCVRCQYEGCERPPRTSGSRYCGAHYQQYLKHGSSGMRPLRDAHPAPASVHREGWTPPRDLSSQWWADVKRDALRREASVARECALDACGGFAVAGSPYCAAHKAYRDAQAKWAREHPA